jgi:hypothetical protein
MPKKYCGESMKDYIQKKYIITLDEAKQRLFNKHNSNISLLEFLGATYKSKFLCNICGNVWSAQTNAVWRKNGCPECKKVKHINRCKRSDEYIKNYISNNECEWISGKYSNERSHIKIKYKCGHVNETSFGSFKKGHRCNICAHKNNNTTNRLSQTQLDELLSINNLTLIEFPQGYKNRSSIIKFTCEFGHINECKLSCLIKNKTCKQCMLIVKSNNQKGSNGSNWQGGLTELKPYVSKLLKDWKKESMKICDYKCVITGKRFQDIHHLYSANLIIKEAVKELNLELKETIGEYSDEELINLSNKVIELHKKYPLGICLIKEIHELFHQIYGYGDTTPEQFYEFKQKIESGEIVIN